MYLLGTFLFWLLKLGTTELVTPSYDLQCEEGHECVTKSSCNFWLEQINRLDSMKPGSLSRARVIEKLRKAVCNKEEKALCCPVEIAVRSNGQTVALDVVEASNKKCLTNSICATRDSCPHWKTKSDKLKTLRRGSYEYNRLREEIQEEICNKQEKGLCCPNMIPTINDSPSYLPSKGECGFNPFKPPSQVRCK